MCCILSFVSILVFLGENDDVLLLLSICQEGCLFDVAIDLGDEGCMYDEIVCGLTLFLGACDACEKCLEIGFI